MSEKNITHPFFGSEVDPLDYIFKALINLPKLNKTSSEVVMRDLYETKFGIYNHLNKNIKKRPMASVGYNESENINIGSNFEESIVTYVVKNINKLYGLTILEFLDLPRYVIEMLVKISDKNPGVTDEDKKMLQEIEKQLKS